MDAPATKCQISHLQQSAVGRQNAEIVLVLCNAADVLVYLITAKKKNKKNCYTAV